MHNYIAQHLRNFFASLGEICRYPINSFLTIGVIGVAVFIPAALFLSLYNIQNIYASWKEPPEITIFLSQTTLESEILKIKANLEKKDSIDTVKVFSPQAALDEFNKLSGKNPVDQYLEKSPFGHILFVKVKPNTPQATIQLLIDKLAQNKDIELINFDADWLHKFNTILKFIEGFTKIITLILSIGIICIIQQIIRLHIQAKQELIAICKLIGATNSFIRREFLYFGFWYGLMGAVFAWLLLKLLIFLLQPSIRDLAILYQSDFKVLSLGLRSLIIISSISIGLTISGAYLAVRKCLK